MGKLENKISLLTSGARAKFEKFSLMLEMLTRKLQVSECQIAFIKKIQQRETHIMTNRIERIKSLNMTQQACENGLQKTFLSLTAISQNLYINDSRLTSTKLKSK